MTDSIQKQVDRICFKEGEQTLEQLLQRIPKAKPDTVRKCLDRWKAKKPAPPPKVDTFKLDADSLIAEIWNQYTVATGKSKLDCLRMLVDVWKTRPTVPEGGDDDAVAQIIARLKFEQYPGSHAPTETES